MFLMLFSKKGITSWVDTFYVLHEYTHLVSATVLFLSKPNISRQILRSWAFDWHSILKLFSSKLLGPRAGQLAPWFPCSAPMWKPCPCPVWRTPCWQMTGLYPVAWFGTTGAATRCATSRRSPGTGPPHRILPKAAPSAAREKSPWSCPCPRSPCVHPRRASRWVMMWDWRMMSTARTFFMWNPPRCLMMRLGSELGSAMVGVVWEELFSEVRTKRNCTLSKRTAVTQNGNTR